MIFLVYASGAQWELVTGQANAAGIHVSIDYGDETTATGALTFAHAQYQITGAATTALRTGTSGHIYKLKACFIRNTSTTATTDVTFQRHDGTLENQIKKATLQPGQELHYIEGVGWYLFQSVSGLFQKRTIYTSGSNTFTPLSSTNSMYVTVLGGGGGGGASGTGNSGNNECGAGGGAGAVTQKKYSLTVGATYTAVVGGGGNGGVVPSNNGSTGTLSSFTDGSTQINGAGGLGGVFGPNIAAAPLVSAGGAGGAANANGDVNETGAPGLPGMRLAATVFIAGSGGSTPYGGGGVGVTSTNTVGAAGTGYGSGGAGGASNNSSGAAGGAGAAGIIIIDEYS